MDGAEAGGTAALQEEASRDDGAEVGGAGVAGAGLRLSLPEIRQPIKLKVKTNYLFTCSFPLCLRQRSCSVTTLIICPIKQSCYD